MLFAGLEGKILCQKKIGTFFDFVNWDAILLPAFYRRNNAINRRVDSMTTDAESRLYSRLQFYLAAIKLYKILQNRSDYYSHCSIYL